jgi:hypothetical protein
MQFTVAWNRKQNLVLVYPATLETPQDFDKLDEMAWPDGQSLLEPRDRRSVFQEVRRLLALYGGDYLHTLVQMTDDGQTTNKPISVQDGMAGKPVEPADNNPPPEGGEGEGEGEGEGTGEGEGIDEGLPTKGRKPKKG